MAPSLEISFPDWGGCEALLKFAQSDMTLPQAERQLEECLGDWFKDGFWSKALKIIMDSENDTTMAIQDLNNLTLKLFNCCITENPKSSWPVKSIVSIDIDKLASPVSIQTQISLRTKAKPIDIDRDIEIEVQPKPPRKEQPQQRPLTADEMKTCCPGILVEFPAGSPFQSFPWGILDECNFPWTIEVLDHKIFFRSDTCLKEDFSVLCNSCLTLKKNKNTHQLREREARYVCQANNSKLNSLNLSHALAIRNHALGKHKRFMLAIASGEIKHVHSLVSVALKQKCGIQTVLEHARLAMDNMYSSCKYGEQDYHYFQLVRLLGGNRLLSIAQKMEYAPSRHTLVRHSETHHLQVSVSYPTITGVVGNINSTFGKDFAMVKRTGYILLVDELAAEACLRYDADNNTILGVCCEHGVSEVLSVNSHDEAELILKHIQSGKIHLSTEAMVAVLGALTGHPKLDTARTILISGTCKKETAPQHVHLLKTAVAAIEKSSSALKGRLWSIASDGESKCGKVLVSIALSMELPATSPIYEDLAYLPLFDIRCGPNDITLDKDYKHVAFKRVRNTIVHPIGMKIAGIASQVKSLLQPNDKQDVPLAHALLRTIASLGPAAADSNATYVHTHEVLIFLSKICSCLVEPYTNINLSLREQLNLLSAAAHCILWLYIHGRGAFMPVQLYEDIMHMTKNAFFCIAKMKHEVPNGSFYLISLGTDCLEAQFGNIRSMIGNNSNADLLQIGS
ncbi:hypothetical protein M422DRAFT_264908 [Sphaerobolus stellatus SS14]|uniref:Uncharacterized protein n=1 Tax=Sphaerobolus stellatus (strain SS14) TaxID=990650 RepID=A0A0C9V762_SPHS4|nr:hypothetical protein M422DRAFT_264908 [Sphaerobolus stellatus SS14]